MKIHRFSLWLVCVPLGVTLCRNAFAMQPQSPPTAGATVTEAPDAPSLQATMGGKLGETIYYVKVRYTYAGGETTASSESSLRVPANSLLVVVSPPATTNATGWNAYVSASKGKETRQNGSKPISIGTNWVEPRSGLLSPGEGMNADGVSMPVGERDLGRLGAVARTPDESEAPRPASVPASDPNVTTSGGTPGNLAMFDASADIANSAVYQKGSNVGIGTTSPPALLSVGSSSQFQVNTSGAMTAIAGQILSGGLVENGGPTYSLAFSFETNNTVTFTTTTSCSLVAGQVVTVSNVNPADYNGTYRVLTGCVGNSFTVLNPESIGANGVGGTVTGSPLFNAGLGGPLTLTALGDTSLPASPFGPIAPFDLYSYRSTNITTPFPFARPQVYIGRNDSSAWGATQCLGTNGVGIGITASCDEPLLLVMGTNGVTNSATPAIAAIEGYVYGGASNVNNPDLSSNYHVGGAFRADDASSPNTVNLRGINTLSVVKGAPSHIGPGNFTRSAFGIENDVNNSSNADAVWGSSGGTGNYIGNYSAVSLGPYNVTTALVFASSSAKGKGYLTGIEGNGAVNCGLCLANGNSVTTTTGIHLTTGGGTGTYGLVVGSGTVSELGIGDSYHQGNPGTGILLDASGTYGNSETVNSNSLTFRAKSGSATGTDWTLSQNGASNILDMTGPPCSSSNVYGTAVGDNLGSRRVEFGYCGPSNPLAGTKRTQAQIVWGTVATAGDLLIGSRGDQATNVIFYTSPDAGATGLVERIRVNSAGNVGVGTPNPSLQLQVKKAMGAGVYSQPNVSGNLTFDASLGNTQTVTLNGDATANTLSNCQPGQWLVFDIIQDGSGNHNFTWSSSFHGGGTTVDQAASHHNRQMFYCDSSTDAWSVAPMQSGP